jgi:transposase-like protein
MTLCCRRWGACPRSSEWCPQSIGISVRLQSEQLSAFVGIRSLEGTFEEEPGSTIHRHAGRRRAWTAEQKQRIAKSYGADETVSAVARRYGMTPQIVKACRAAGQPLATGMGEHGAFAPAIVERAPRHPPAVRAGSHSSHPRRLDRERLQDCNRAWMNRSSTVGSRARPAGLPDRHPSHRLRLVASREKVLAQPRPVHAKMERTVS